MLVSLLVGDAETLCADEYMNIKLTNKCQIKYWQDPLKIVNGILNKIPEKFLIGLTEVKFFDESNNPVVKYIPGKEGGNNSKIEIYMGGFSNGSKYSVFHLNLLFLSHITDHIVKNLKPTSNDSEILSVKPHRFNPKWMYLGWSTPVLVPLKIFYFAYEKFKPFRLWFDKKKENLLKDIPKST